MDEKLTSSDPGDGSPYPVKGNFATATPYLKTKTGPVASPLAYLTISCVATAIVLGLGYTVTSPPETYHVAFIGSRFLAINDLPRMMEALSNGTWTQQSLIHAKGSLYTIPSTGNGMYTVWKKDTAYLDEEGIYDYGACTVEQLFSGQDDTMMYQNQNAFYYDDGLNPCFQDDDYYSYVKTHPANATGYDLVILADDAKRMAFNATVSPTLEVLTNYYSPYIDQAGAVPIVISPYAFWSDRSNMTGLEDVAVFTSKIWDGSLKYFHALNTNRTAKIAPVSLAFLTVYEEDLDMWTRLFDSYGVHASLYGSYLTGLVLYATATDRMPKADADPEIFFASSRSTSGAAAWGSPTVEESKYLWDVAKRVVLKKYKPDTLEIYDD